jgi:coniferyl-aldehyde dehydrogenase
VLGATDAMSVMQDEIFGPILPVHAYGALEEAITFVNDRPRPLALYYFGHDPNDVGRVLDETVSGGVCVNETLLHVASTTSPSAAWAPAASGTITAVRASSRSRR